MDMASNLVDVAIEALRESTGIVLSRVPAGRAKTGDALVELRHGARKLRYLVEAKAKVDRFAALASVKAREGERPVLLVTSPLSSEMAQQCRALGIQFVDTAGNAYLHAPDLHVFVAGMKGAAPSALRRPTQGSSSPAALRMIFVLLAKQAMLNASYREIADAAGIAIGNIGAVFADLTARGFIVQSESRGRLLVHGDRLLDEWVSGYATRLRPKLRVRRFQAADAANLMQVQFEPTAALWGSEVAAAKLTHYLKPGTQTLFVAPDAADGVVKKLALAARLRADPQGSVEIVDAFWNLNALASSEGVVPAVLVYADLLATMDPRCIETAKLVRQDWIENA